MAGFLLLFIAFKNSFQNIQQLRGLLHGLGSYSSSNGSKIISSKPFVPYGILKISPHRKHMALFSHSSISLSYSSFSSFFFLRSSSPRPWTQIARIGRTITQRIARAIDKCQQYQTTPIPIIKDSTRQPEESSSEYTGGAAAAANCDCVWRDDSEDPLRTPMLPPDPIPTPPMLVVSFSDEVPSACITLRLFHPVDPHFGQFMVSSAVMYLCLPSVSSMPVETPIILAHPTRRKATPAKP